MPGVAENTTVVPEQILIEVAEMEREAVTGCFTVIITVLEVTCEVLEQEALEVITHVTLAPFVSEAVLNVEAVPEFAPFTFHW